MSLREKLKGLVAGLLPSGGIAEQTVKSGIWATIANVGGRALQIVLVIVLARLLGPSQFGLMGIALLTIATLRHLTNLGIDEALIQKESDDVDSYLNTVFTLEIGRGIAITAVVFVAAPAIASFFGEPRATDIIRVAGLSPLLMSVRNPGIIYFQKDLQFHKEALYKLSYSVTRFVVGVGYALVSPTVWALVVSYIVADLARVAVSYVAHGHRPRPELDLSLARDLINYGKWITGGSILYFIYSQGDDIVVGAVLSASSLGLYQVAYQLSNAPGTEITEVITRVSFPSFSKLQGDTAALREAFFRTLQIATFVAFPAAVGIAVVAPTFVRAFMGQQWLPMVTTMQILAVYGLLLSLTAVYPPVWKTLDRPDVGTKLALVRVVLLAIFVVPMTSLYGIEGTALTVVGIYIFPMLPLDTYFVVTFLETSYTRVAREVAYPTVASALMGAGVLAVDQAVTLQAPLLQFGLLLVTGLVTYVTVVVLLATQFRWTIDQNIRTMYDAVR